LEVFGQQESVMLANAPGSAAPVAILDNKAVDLLFDQNRRAKAEAEQGGRNSPASLHLFATLDGILKSYRKMRDEYYDRIDIEREREEAEQRLQEASNAINASNPTPSDQ
jgi:hypothetical protein